ncbi:hypothetical protein EI94DRAFT_1723920 [Lactarius quietus]|nr:hypothetical protein EI94DRAFT_1723920 [Lactarius quietus]
MANTFAGEDVKGRVRGPSRERRSSRCEHARRHALQVGRDCARERSGRGFSRWTLVEVGCWPTQA